MKSGKVQHSKEFRLSMARKEYHQNAKKERSEKFKQMISRPLVTK